VAAWTIIVAADCAFVDTADGLKLQGRNIMKLMYRVVLGVTLALTVFGTLAFKRRHADRAAVPVLTNEEVLATGRQEPVGWVFGRVMGVAGADRPLMTASGPYGGPTNLPVAGNGR